MFDQGTKPSLVNSIRGIFEYIPDNLSFIARSVLVCHPITLHMIKQLCLLYMRNAAQLKDLKVISTKSKKHLIGAPSIYRPYSSIIQHGENNNFH